MRSRLALLIGLGLGVAAALLLDPVSGHRRRRRLGDAAVHVARTGGRTAGRVRRDVQNRARGIMARTRRQIASDQPDDVVLEERVRAAIGHIVPHPHTISVTARSGYVTLDGPMLISEDHRLTYAVRAVPGVKHVETQFNRHIQPATMRS
jgi:osmotically-inducible protein OsmY